MTKYKVVRMRYVTFLKLRKLFIGKRNESLSDYFDRILPIIEMKGGIVD